MDEVAGDLPGGEVEKMEKDVVFIEP